MTDELERFKRDLLKSVKQMRRGEAARLGYQQVVDDRSKTLRSALSDIRSRATSRRPEEAIPPF